MTILGKILAILNVLAALVLGFLLLLDYSKRQSWSYAVFRHDLALQGLPMELDNLDPNIPRERILTQHLDDETLKAVFSPVGGEPVKTLEDELRRLQGKLPGDIEATVGEVMEALRSVSEEGKKNVLTKFLLLPLARTGPQIDALNRKIQSAKAADVDALCQEAAKRTILNDLLGPLQQMAPAEAGENLLPQVADYDEAKRQFTVPGEKLDDFLTQRLTQIASPNLVGAGGGGETKRDPEDRRLEVSNLIFAIDHLTKPSLDDKLSDKLIYENGPARAQVVLGLVQYNVSTERYVKALDRIDQRVVAAIAADRDGIEGKLPGFVSEYRELIQRMRGLAEDVKDRQRRLEDLKVERKKYEDDLRERKSYYDEIVKKIMDNRAETLKLARELHRVQQQLFLAQREMSSAFEVNREMERQIRELEGLKKGAR